MDNLELILEKLDIMQKEMDKKFEEIDKRFDQIDKKFEEIDKRFDQVDKKFEEIDDRFNQIHEEIKNEGIRLEKVLKKEVIDKMFEFEIIYSRKIDIAVEGLQLANEKVSSQNTTIRGLEARVDRLASYQLDNESQIHMLIQCLKDFGGENAEYAEKIKEMQHHKRVANR